MDVQEFCDQIKEGAIARERASFALEVLEDTWEVLQENNLDQVSYEKQVTLDAGTWEEIRSTLEFTVKILKGEEVRGG
ncbi:MAG TPA: hypothetical protein VFA10_18050 [Ktedonobacteraceae bacterium]|nr:hypothetical protein [Ktedonobacteraceae bacterium]